MGASRPESGSHYPFGWACKRRAYYWLPAGVASVRQKCTSYANTAEVVEAVSGFESHSNIPRRDLQVRDFHIRAVKKTGPRSHERTRSLFFVRPCFMKKFQVQAQGAISI